MDKRFYTVIVTSAQGTPVSYLAYARSQQSAMKMARKFSGNPDASDGDIRVVQPEAGVSGPLAEIGQIFPEAEILVIALPDRGWIINAYSADGQVLKKQFLVAVEDADEALELATIWIPSTLVVQIGAEVQQQHLIRRKMKSGEVFELGVQRIARGKNLNGR